LIWRDAVSSDKTLRRSAGSGLSLESADWNVSGRGHPTKPKAHGRLSQSWFRRGLDYLHRLLVPLAGKAETTGFDRAMLLLTRGHLPAKICLQGTVDLFQKCGEKKRHTLKTQVVLAYPSRRIVAIDVTQGSVHDLTQLRQSGMILHEQSVLLGDRGVEGWHPESVLPFRKSSVPGLVKSERKLSREQRAVNRALAPVRIAMEQVNPRLKVFRILSSRYRNGRRRFTLRVNLIVAIYN
jgi:hypothetical protein